MLPHFVPDSVISTIVYADVSEHTLCRATDVDKEDHRQAFLGKPFLAQELRTWHVPVLKL